jgi:hypothetical protein
VNRFGVAVVSVDGMSQAKDSQVAIRDDEAFWEMKVRLVDLLPRLNEQVLLR